MKTLPDAALLLIALGLGAAGSYAMAPTGIAPLILLSLGGLYYILHALNDKPWKAALAGWLFGFGYFGLGLIWIGNALLVEGNDYRWAWPLAVCVLPAMLSLFTALATYISTRFFRLATLKGLLAFTIALFASEWLRGHIFTGFPWNLFGYAWGGVPAMLGILPITGIYGLTLLTIFWGAALAYPFTANSIRQKIILPATAIILFIACALIGMNDPIQPSHRESGLQTTIRIVQPNIPQSKKWDGSLMREHFEKLLRLSIAQGGEAQTTLIIWPETAINYMFLESERAMELMRAMLASYEHDVYLVTGILLKNPDKTNANSLVVIDKQGQVIHRYDKFHLVPFGEYIPFQKWIPIETVSGFSGFVPGPGNITITLPNGFSFSPLICYEILFPGKVLDRNNEPFAIINVTNDGWYGNSAGPHQHLQKAIFRAAEENVYVLRAANTGVSAAIDSDGKIMESADLETENVLTVTLP